MHPATVKAIYRILMSVGIAGLGLFMLDWLVKWPLHLDVLAWVAFAASWGYYFGWRDALWLAFKANLRRLQKEKICICFIEKGTRYCGACGSELFGTESRCILCKTRCLSSGHHPQVEVA